MKSILKIIASILLFVSVFFTNPGNASAQLHWGGLDVGDYYYTCTCANSLAMGIVYSWFYPLYLNNPTPYTGALTWSYYLGSFTFANYYIHPGAWGLGYYTPGIQLCWFVVSYYPYTCAPLYTIGHIYGSGSSP
ncbi:MAG: hypothetical protein M3Q63_01555 [bacterium]|nr:hypothetical protein [bacterium]